MFRSQQQNMIALAEALKEQTDFLAYSINPIGMPYEQWRMLIETSQADIARIENLLSQLKAVFVDCLEA